MKVRYRIVQEITPQGDWETIGVITDWESAPPHLRLNGIVTHTVSRPIWGTIMERVEEQHLTLENYHEAIGEYARYYRLLPEIHEIEADTAVEIRKRLRNQYVYGNLLPAAEPIAA